MTNLEREEYQRRVRELAAERAELKPRRSFGQKVRDLLGIQPRLVVQPKHRISGPRFCVDGNAWHTAAFQRRLCELCKTVTLEGSGELKAGRFCGACASRGLPNTAKPLTDDGPKAA